MKTRRETSPPPERPFRSVGSSFSPSTTPAVSALSRMVWYFVKLVVRASEAVLFQLAPCWDRTNDVVAVILPRSPPLISALSWFSQLESDLLKMSVKIIKYWPVKISSKVLSNTEVFLTSLDQWELPGGGGLNLFSLSSLVLTPLRT